MRGMQDSREETNLSVMGTPGTPIGSSSVARREDVAKLQRKLQRSYSEKNMLLAEIQKLKEQVNLNRLNGSGGAGGGGGGIAAPDGDANKDSWNRLLEANVRSGTIACMWCIKTQVVRMQALAFNRWKTQLLFRSWPGSAGSAGSAGAMFQRVGEQDSGLRGGRGLQINTSAGLSPLAGRREQLCKLCAWRTKRTARHLQ